MAILEKGEGTFLKITILNKDEVTCWNGDFESMGNNLLKITTLKKDEMVTLNVGEITFWKSLLWK